MEVMPVRRVDDRHFKAGHVSKLLRAKYRDAVSGYLMEKKGENPSLWE